MTFLNPLLLLGLVAAAIPILIHLLNLRKLKTIEFSSLRFLKELQQTSIRRLKIRQILLLILRTLLVIAIVLAFSRPALRGSLTSPMGSRAASTIVLAIDDSPSMTVRNEMGSLFEQARSAAGRLLDVATDGDEIYLVTLSDIRYAEDFTAAYNVASVRSGLAALSPSGAHVLFRELAGKVARILVGSRNINREVYIITDRQASQFTVQPEDSADLFDEGTRFFFVTVPFPNASMNLGVGEVRYGAQIVSPGKPITLEVLVQNTGSVAAADAAVSVHLDGRRSAQQSVDLPAGGRTLVSFTLIPQRTGLLEGSVGLEDDLFEGDNKRSFVVDVPEQIRVGLVGTPEASFFPRLALSAVRQIGGGNLFSLTQMEETALASFDGSAFNLIVLCDVGNMTPGAGERLAAFVRGGGGLAIFPGPHTDIRVLNRELLRPLEIPGASGPQGSVPANTGENDEAGFLSFTTTDLSHPLFAGLFEEEPGGRASNGETESPHIHRSFTIRGAQADNSLIGLSDGTPFLLECTRGSGKVFLFATDAGDGWSDFPFKSLYAPLMHRSAVYLATGRQAAGDIHVGDPVTLSLRLRETPGAEFELRSPSGMTGRLIPRLNPATGLSAFTSPPAREPGIYALLESGRSGRAPLALAPVNIDPAESDLTALADTALERACILLGIPVSNIEVLQASGEMAAAVLESRFGIELWKYFAGLALLLAIAEMIVARATRRDIGPETMA
jgi:hypothetical protein